MNKTIDFKTAKTIDTMTRSGFDRDPAGGGSAHPALL